MKQTYFTNTKILYILIIIVFLSCFEKNNDNCNIDKIDNIIWFKLNLKCYFEMERDYYRAVSNKKTLIENINVSEYNEFLNIFNIYNYLIYVNNTIVLDDDFLYLKINPFDKVVTFYLFFDENNKEINEYPVSFYCKYNKIIKKYMQEVLINSEIPNIIYNEF